MTWLLVEDDPDIRNVVAVMMQLWGETALALPDGNAAWRWLDGVEAGTTADLPELALMDIRMPGHTGDQIAARIRRTERLKHIPIVLMTAFSLSETEVQNMKQTAGIDHLIRKPLPDMDEFRSALYRVRDEKRLVLIASTTVAPLPISAAMPAIEPLPPVLPPIDPNPLKPPVVDPPQKPPIIDPPLTPPTTPPLPPVIDLPMPPIIDPPAAPVITSAIDRPIDKVVLPTAAPAVAPAVTTPTVTH